jgi:hypothetical protein
MAYFKVMSDHLLEETLANSVNPSQDKHLAGLEIKLFPQNCEANMLGKQDFRFSQWCF